VVRLFTQAYLAKAGIETGGLWDISRGLARRVGDYRALLARADISSESSLAPLAINFPSASVGYFFPRLYPEGVELSAP